MQLNKYWSSCLKIEIFATTDETGIGKRCVEWQYFQLTSVGVIAEPE